MTPEGIRITSQSAICEACGIHMCTVPLKEPWTAQIAANCPEPDQATRMHQIAGGASELLDPAPDVKVREL